MLRARHAISASGTWYLHLLLDFLPYLRDQRLLLLSKLIWLRRLCDADIFLYHIEGITIQTRSCLFEENWTRTLNLDDESYEWNEW